VKETIDQVSPDLELVGTFKINSQNCYSWSWTGNDKTVGTSRSRVFAKQLKLRQI
jgi:hypothetical protein